MPHMQQTLRPLERLDRRPPMERLRSSFAMKGFMIFGLKRRFGTGFIATRASDAQMSALRVRSKGHDIYEVQPLEKPCSVRPHVIEEVRAWAKVEFDFVDVPVNDTQPGGPFRWNELVSTKDLVRMTHPVAPLSRTKPPRNNGKHRRV